MEKPCVIITGGSRGIGAEIVQKLVRDGYFPVFSYKNNEAMAQKLREQIGKDKCDIFQLDMEDKNSIKDACKAVIKTYDKSIKGLVVNAGVTKDTFLCMMPEEDWDSVIDINFKNQFHILQSFGKHFIRLKQAASIVCLASIGARRSAAGQSNYASSKAAQIAMCKSLARELGRYGIRVNTVSPGFVETDMTTAINPDILAAMVKSIPLGRVGRASEVAELVEFLLSERASYITGSDIVIDGGVL